MRSFEEVKEALRVCSDWSKAAYPHNTENCPYFDKVYHACCGFGKDDLIRDTYHYLCDPEKVENIYECKIGDHICIIGSCGACGAPMVKGDKHCSEWGRKLEWPE